MDKLSNFEFEYPFAFLLLLLIICIYKCPFVIKKIIFPHLHLFKTSTTWINKEKLLYSFIITLLVTSLASPISYDQKSSDNKKGRDLVFALDTSGSMGESGFDKENPENKKLETLKEILKKFVTTRYDDNVGVTIFGTYAFSAIPLTYDMKSISYLLDFFDVGIAGDSTAMGDGIANALGILEKGNAKEKVIILVTDGFNNTGEISIKTSIEKAKENRVKIYTIGLGDKKSYDAKLLQKIAQDSNGKAFSSQDAQMLENIYMQMNSLEPSPIQSQHYLDKHSFYSIPLSLGAILIFSLLLLRSREYL
jgi:Ca-activated chloride channel family protein